MEKKELQPSDGLVKLVVVIRMLLQINLVLFVGQLQVRREEQKRLPKKNVLYSVFVAVFILLFFEMD